MDIRRVKLNEILFFSALMCYCAHYFIDGSLIESKIPAILKVLKAVILALLFFKWMIAERYNKKKTAVWGIFLIAVFMVSITGKYKGILLSMCLVISGQDIEFDKIVKVLLTNTLAWSAVIVLLCKAGFLPDYTFVHQLGASSTIGHSYGFRYYSWIGYIAMAVTMMWIYLRKKAGLLELLILAVMNYLLYKVHTTNLSFYITLMFMLAYYCVEKLKIVRFQGRFWKFLATILPFSLCGVTMAAVIAYGKGIFSVSVSWMNTIVGRLEYSVEALQRYGIHLFATRVEQLGNTAMIYEGAETAFYIDSGYVYSIIAYGIFFTLISLTLYTLLFRHLYYMKERILYLWIATLLFASIINNFAYDIINNPVLFLIPAAVFGNRRKLKAGGKTCAQ